MNKLKTHLLIASLIFNPILSFAATNQGSPRLVDAGNDGSERYYIVYCPDGRRGSVVNYYEEGKVCTRPEGAQEDICSAWTIDEAAKAACN